MVLSSSTGALGPVDDYRIIFAASLLREEFSLDYILASGGFGQLRSPCDILGYARRCTRSFSSFMLYVYNTIFRSMIGYDNRRRHN